MENNDGRKRVKTAAHIGDDYYALCYYSSKDQIPFLPQIWAFSSPHYASRCEAALVVRRAAACGSASGEIASGQSVVGQQVRQCLGRSETTVLSRDRYGVRISHCTYTLSIPYLWVPMSFIIGESFFGQISTWKNTILTLCNGFFILKKWTQILPYFEERKKNSKLPHFYVKFQ